MRTVSTSRARRLLSRAWNLAVACAITAAACPALADGAQYFYDPAGRLTTVIDPVNGSAVYAYDQVGNILSVVQSSTPSSGPSNACH